MRLRELFPWRDFTIETSWSPDVSAGALGKHIDEPRLFSQGCAPFVASLFPRGSSGGREFHFRRNISGKNPSLPMILAVVEPSTGWVSTLLPGMGHAARRAGLPLVAVLLGCGGVTSGEAQDAQRPVGDARAEDTTSPQDAAADVCSIVPTPMHPPARQVVCSTAELATDAASVECFELDAGSACEKCIFGGASFAPTWGPVFPIGRVDVQQFYNTPGCVDLVAGLVAEEPHSCGDALYARDECLELACDYGAALPPCPVGADAGSCDEQALRGPCKAYEDQVRSASGPCSRWLTSDGGPTAAVAKCFPQGPITDPKSRCAYLQSLATVFCGR
jgi:hypothetical protein